MTNPLSRQSTDPARRPDWTDVQAMKHAAGGDILDMVLELMRRVERLEAQLKTH